MSYQFVRKSLNFNYNYAILLGRYWLAEGLNGIRIL